MNAVQWLFKLIDGVSNPAGRAERAVRRLQSAEEFATRATTRFGGVMAALRTPARAVVGAMGVVRGAISSVFSLPGLIAGGAVAAGIKAIIDAAGYKEQQIIGFTTMLKSSSKAALLYASAVKFADQTPFETTDVLEATKKMLAFQFTTKQIPRIMTAAGDAVSSLGGGAAELQGMITAFGQIRAKGKLSSEELNQFAERGVPAVQFLAKALKTDTAGALKLVEKGAVSSQVAITAITEGMETAFGGGMAKQARTIFGLVSTLKSRPFALFSNIDKSGALEPFRGLLENLANLTDFNKAPGNKIAAMFNRSVGGLFKAVFGNAEKATRGAAGERFVSGVIGVIDRISRFITNEGPGIAQTVSTVFSTISSAVGFAASAIKTLGPFIPTILAFFAAFKAVQAFVALDMFILSIGGLSKVLPTLLASVGGPWGLLIAAIVAGVTLIVMNWDKIRPVIQPALDWMAGAFRSVMGFIGTLPAFFTGVWNNVTTIFNNAVNFLAQFPFTPIGAIAFLIKNFDKLPAAFSAIWQRVTDVFNGVTTWFSSLPQKFMDLGSQLIMGLVNGITGRLNAVKDAVVGAANSAVGWFKSVLGIQSPSRVFQMLGSQLPAGLERGIMSGEKMVTKAVKAVGAAAMVTGSVATAAGTKAAEPVAARAVVKSQVQAVQPQSSSRGAPRKIELTVNVKGEPGANPATLEQYKAITVEAVREALELEMLEIKG
jgi:tape measure domain-containing protein